MDSGEWERLDRKVRGLTPADRLWVEHQGYEADFDLGACDLDYIAQAVLGMRSDARPTPASTAQRESTHTNDRAWVLSRLLAEEASEEESVQRFRSRHLRHGFVRAEQEAVGDWIVANSGGDQDRSVVVLWGIAETRRTMVAADSPAADLHRVAADLATFYGWQENQAVAFVLCDGVPIHSPLRVTHRFRSIPAASRIVLDIDPTLPPTEVEAMYREARKTFGRGRYRELSERALHAVAFALEHDEMGQNEMCTEWNDAHPDWTYPNGQAFARAVRETTNRILNPFS